MQSVILLSTLPAPPAAKTMGSNVYLTSAMVCNEEAIVDVELNEDGLVQAKLWIQSYHVLWKVPCKRDLDTCLTPEAKNWRDLNYSL